MNFTKVRKLLHGSKLREKASESIIQSTVSIEVVHVNKAEKISAGNLLGNYVASWLKQANKNGGHSKQILSHNSS